MKIQYNSTIFCVVVEINLYIQSAKTAYPIQCSINFHWDATVWPTKNGWGTESGEKMKKKKRIGQPIINMWCE